MRKLDLANQVKERVGGVSKKEAGILVNLLLDTIRETLLQGENVKISGFGSFVVRGKKDRVGRNPHSGEELLIPARQVLTFKPSQLLRDRLNEK
jgi:integration host factor subunit alpha